MSGETDRLRRGVEITGVIAESFVPGDILYATTGSAERIQLKLANLADPTKSSRAMLFVATRVGVVDGAPYPLRQFPCASDFYMKSGSSSVPLDTSMFTAGQIVYLSGTPGKYSGTVSAVPVGIVLRSHATLGEILFCPQYLKAAAQISVQDASGYLAATDVEGAIAEMCAAYGIINEAAPASGGTFNFGGRARKSFYITIGSGAYTATLPAPTAFGQEAIFQVAAAGGGTATITLASGTLFPDTTKTGFTMNALTNMIILQAIRSAGGSPLWTVVFNNGAVLV